MKTTKQAGPLRTRFFAVLFLTSISLCMITIIGTCLIYSSALSFRYESLCKTVSETVAGSIDADSVNPWLKGQNTREYIQMNNLLRQLSKDVSDLESIAVYQMRTDGMHTVFDTNSTSLRGGLGDLIAYDSSWEHYKSDFLASKEVGKITVKSSSGKVLMYCIPIFDSESNCVSYVCSSVSMNLIHNDLTVFLKQYGLLLLVITLLLSVVLAIFIERRITKPLKSICDVSDRAAKVNDIEFLKEITSKKIKTGDEIENIWRSIIKIYTDKVQLMAALEKAQDNTVVTFATLIRRIDSYTANHIDNTRQYVILLVNALRKKEKYKNVITDSIYNNIIHAASLHDIGKLSVPEHILNKPAKLTAEEYEIMKEHTLYGARLIEETAKNVQDAEYLKLARQLCESHHERWDGKGYPYGLKGEEIPLPVRIVAVADVFDALVSERCYKSEIPFEEAYQIMIDESGTHFDPDIVAVFVEIKEQIFDVYNRISVE